MMLYILSLCLLSITAVESRAASDDVCTQCKEKIDQLKHIRDTDSACVVPSSKEDCRKTMESLEKGLAELEKNCQDRGCGDENARFLAGLFSPMQVISNTTKTVGDLATGTVDIANTVVKTASDVLSNTVSNVPIAGGLLSGIISGVSQTVGGVAGGVNSILKGTTDGLASLFNIFG